MTNNARPTYGTPTGVSVYNGLFAIVTILNLTSIIAYLASTMRPATTKEARGAVLITIASRVRLAFAGNLFASILIRNDHFVNLMYRCLVLHACHAPLWFRRRFAGVYNMGGVHSGCATAAVMWYVVGIGIDILAGNVKSSIRIFGMAISLLSLATLFIVVATSIRSIRRLHHNVFELSHRFGGWLLLVLLWLQLTLRLASGTADETSRSNRTTFSTEPSVWFLALSTALIIYPWSRVRRVDIEIRPMSKHAVEISLPLAVQPCRTIRVSRNPLLDSHSFAAISDAKESGRSSIIVSRAGDWTSAVIDQPPSKLWLRETAAWGVVRVATLFKSCTIVATGSGIGPCLSLFRGHPTLLCRVLWSTKSPLRTYGASVVDAVRRVDPQAYIIDTTERGRVDMMQAALSFQNMVRAEAVIIISNPELTRTMLAAFRKRGVPAYGPIWDS